ncbi:hypothetical protein K466DRAFT_571912 [Polyporus arcularius HHB13444]|uniref:WD40 repeat-like protein n=1 Tax=Polyporus arcularius HHB13444 TaxID=1314778 RepID=A0A5C3PXA4_9APHY|nr:hypothetical protein K466DRAFT_571912 [Polyporus arcularius HHB13444]
MPACTACPLEEKFPDIPEVVKYQPGEINLAVQCNNGAVYIIRDGPGDAGPVRHLIVAQAQLKHVTADMHWGLGRTKNLLFASSACLADGTGYHRAFDVAKGRAVVNFDAEGQACSTLTTDPFGDNLYIATEGPDSRYTLRQYDVRDLARKTAKQHIDLEPFAGNPSRNDMDINCLSVSSDGIYIAAGRMDNRLDVYDARMLARGLLYNFAHEGGGPGTDSYGVVKVQWVDGVPYGTGFLSGGVDGCVRLWDMKLAGEDPRNGEVLARCDYDVATFTLGNMYEGEAPLVVGERSGKVTMFGYQKPDPWD